MKRKGIEFLLDVTNKASVVESLEKNEVDFSLVSVVPDHLQLERIELMENKLYLVGSKEQRFKKKLHKKDILNEVPLIYREEGSGTRHVMEKFIRQNNLPVKKTMELTSNEAVKQAVIAGLGYSILPLIGIKNELNNGDLRIIPVQGFPIKSNWSIIWMKGKKFSPVASAYITYIKEEKDRIIGQKFEWYDHY